MPTGRARSATSWAATRPSAEQSIGAVGGFSTAIGRNVQGRKSRPLGCEETEFCIRLAQRRPESVLMFEPDAVIHHKVPAARCTLAYLRRRCYAEGLSKALVTHSVGATGRAGHRAGLHVQDTAAGRAARAGRRPAGRLGRARPRRRRSCSGSRATTWGYVVGTARLRARIRRG